MEFRFSSVSYSLFVASAIAFSMSCEAQVHKCIAPSGKVEFTDAPCASSARGGQVQVKPNVVDASESREHVLREENRQLREDLQTRNQIERGSTDRPNTESPQDKSYTYACEIARKNYETTKSSSRLDKRSRDTSAERLNMEMACGAPMSSRSRARDDADVVIPPPRPKSPPPPVITRCVPGYCYDSNGNAIPTAF